MVTGNQGVLDAAVLTQFGIDNPQAVQAYRDEARAGAITWWGAAALASLAFALAWLLLSALRDPSTPQEARSGAPGLGARPPPRPASGLSGRVICGSSQRP
jgi:hypothetical protein